MKFFQKSNFIKLVDKNSYVFNFKNFFKKKSKVGYRQQYTTINTFSTFLIKDGFFIKAKLLLSGVLKNINYFFYNNLNYLTLNHPTTK